MEESIPGTLCILENVPDKFAPLPEQPYYQVRTNQVVKMEQRFKAKLDLVTSISTVVCSSHR